MPITYKKNKNTQRVQASAKTNPVLIQNQDLESESGTRWFPKFNAAFLVSKIHLW